jgi:glutathione S-transferase
MRARLAMWTCGIEFELREVHLKNKPQAMLDISPKGTVPVLQLPTEEVIDESIEIMRWALQQRDPNEWLRYWNAESEALVATNDGNFKSALDRYKYADRYPQQSAETYRAEGELFLAELNRRIQSHSEALNPSSQRGYLMGNKASLTDMAIFPFVRQFAHVDKPWFESTHYCFLIAWLDELLNSALFQSIMLKYQPWAIENEPLLINDTTL